MGGAKKRMMDIQERGFEETDGRSVCLNCVLDEGLRSQLTSLLTQSSCSFCEEESIDGSTIAVDFEEFMPLIMEAIYFFYERSSESLFVSDDFTVRYSSEEVAHDVCGGGVTERVLEGIVAVISEDEWNTDPGELSPDVAMRGAWEDFRTKVKHKTRFVFLSIPEERSEHRDEFTTSEILEKLMEIIERRNVLLDVPKGHVFIRGRLVDDLNDLEAYDAKSLGAPPDAKASANRMSPAGISMFYGSDDVETVVAEIGAHKTSRFAVVGEFETTRKLRMVNLAELPQVPSVFSPSGREGYFDILFLHSFARDLSAPVSIDGSEHIDYVPTQVVTEYMRWLPDYSLDGVLFTSSQNGGRSCVVFCGSEACADVGEENEETILRLREGSVRAVRVVAVPGAL